MPVINAIEFDKAAYFKGDTIKCTVSYSADLAFNVTGTAVDIAGQSASLAGTVTVHGVAAVSDSGSRTWAKVSDDGATAVFTATA